MKFSLLRLLVLGLVLTGLAGCSALSALTDATTPLEVYELRAPDDIPAARGAPLALSVIIEEPTTGGALQTDRIMIRPSPLQAQYLAGVRWSDTVPVMVQTLMLRSLASTQALRYVGRSPIGPGGDFAVLTEVTDFQAEAGADGVSALIRLSISANLVREDDAQIVASRTFSATARSSTTEVPELIRAFDAASDTLLRDFALWLTGALGRRL